MELYINFAGKTGTLSSLLQVPEFLDADFGCTNIKLHSHAETI